MSDPHSQSQTPREALVSHLLCPVGSSTSPRELKSWLAFYGLFLSKPLATLLWSLVGAGEGSSLLFIPVALGLPSIPYSKCNIHTLESSISTSQEYQTAGEHQGAQTAKGVGCATCCCCCFWLAQCKENALLLPEPIQVQTTAELKETLRISKKKS